MTKPTSKKKRNKLTVIILAPILLILLITGWYLYRKRPKEPKHKTTTKTNQQNTCNVPNQQPNDNNIFSCQNNRNPEN